MVGGWVEFTHQLIKKAEANVPRGLEPVGQYISADSFGGSGGRQGMKHS